MNNKARINSKINNFRKPYKRAMSNRIKRTRSNKVSTSEAVGWCSFHNMNMEENFIKIAKKEKCYSCYRFIKYKKE